MKKFLMVALAAMLLAGMSFSATMAQFTTVTSFRVQNLSAQTANIQLMYYNSTGAVETLATANDTIAAGASKQYVQANNTLLPNAFNGSVVIASDQPVAAIGIQDAVSGTAPNDIHYQGTYGGFSATDSATKFYLPVIMREYYGYTTEISIQNAGTSDVNAIITYSNGVSETLTGIKPGAVRRVANSASNLGIKFNGSAIIDATGPIVAVVNEQNLTNREEQTYEGVSAAKASNTLYVPNLMKQYYSWNTSFQVQNIGATTTTITVTMSYTGLVYVDTIAPGASKLYVQSTENTLPVKFLGSAVVQAAPGGTITAIVHGQDPINHKAAAFNAFPSSAAVIKYVAPDVMRHFYSYDSSVQVMNVGTADTTCSAHFVGTNTGGAVDKTQVSTNIKPLGTYLYVQSIYTDLGERFGGSVELSCGGQPFVAIVNQNGPANHGDNAMAYNAFPAQ